MKQAHPLRAVVALLLTLALCLAMATPAFAVGDTTSASTKVTASAGDFAGGSGTKRDPYHIKTVAQLKNINNDLGACYVLDKDLDLSDSSLWMPIGYFSIDPTAEDMSVIPEEYSFHGDFDGNGHTIKNMDILSGNILCAGLFGFVSGNGCIHDLKMKNSEVAGFMSAGAVAGWVSGKATLKNITVTGVTHIISMMYSGGVVGRSNSKGTFSNIKAKAIARVYGPSPLQGYGGIIVGGADNTNFKNCTVTGGTVTDNGSGTKGYGGLAGSAYNTKSIKNCTVKNVTINVIGSETAMVGGLVGFTGTEAGLKKKSKRTKVQNCTVENTTLNVKGDTERVGLLIGSCAYIVGGSQKSPLPILIKNCSSQGRVIGGKYVGSILGYKGKNTEIKKSTGSGTWNGKKLKKTVGATTSSVPVSKLSGAANEAQYEDDAAYVKYTTTNPYITEDTWISAHRSGGGIEPEETMKAFQNCAESTTFQVDLFEFDLHITKDNVLVLLHDDTLDRTSNCEEVFGKEDCAPEDYTYAELRKLNMGAKFETDDGKMPYAKLLDSEVPDDLRIPRIEEVLDYLIEEGNGKYCYIIEIKNDMALGRKGMDILHQLLVDRGIIDQCIFGTFHPEISEYVDAAYPDFRRSASIPEVLDFVIAAASEMDAYEAPCSVLQIPYSSPYKEILPFLGSQKVINYAHSKDIAVQYWTINDKEDMQTLLDRHADAIISDYPNVVYQVKYGK